MSGDPIFRSYHIRQSNQYGGDLPYFVGKQYGSGWLRTLAKVAFPIVKRIAGVAGKVAKDVVVKEKPLVKSLRTRALNEVGKTVLGQNNSTSQQQQTINRGRKRKSDANTFPIFTQQKKSRPAKKRRRQRI